MKCIVCGRYSLAIICKQCQQNIQLSPSVRVVDDLSVYSFFAYSHIEYLLHYKYQPIGSRIYHLLARIALDCMREKIYQVFGNLGEKVCGVGIDDHCAKGYSHTGILLKEFSKLGIKPIYGELLAQNKIRYAGKNLEYRETHPKNLQTKLHNQTLIIIDDIITTGTSIKEANQVLKAQHNEVLCAIVLCDARS